MTPVSLNPPGPSIGQNQLFISPNNQDCPTLFNIDRRQMIEIGEFRENNNQDDKLVLHDGSSSNNQLCNSSFISPQPVKDDPNKTCDPYLSFSKMEEEDSKNDHGSTKWMSSKMRLMKKMMRPSSSSTASDKTISTTISITPSPRFQNQGHENRYSQKSPRNNSNSIIRVCSDCNTSSTPLWRSGPKGPKSLCNACGIRQRKARRAMAEAANGLATSVNSTSTKIRVCNKEKKPRSNHFAQFKNKHKSTTSTTTSGGSSQGVRKLEYFKDLTISLRNNSAFHHQVFPRDEVAEAALLLMDLSCGFVHS